MEENPEKSKDDKSEGQIKGKMFFLPGEKVRDFWLGLQKHADAGQDQQQISGKNIPVGLPVRQGKEQDNPERSDQEKTQKGISKEPGLLFF